MAFTPVDLPLTGPRHPFHLEDVGMALDEAAAAAAEDQVPVGGGRKVPEERRPAEPCEACGGPGIISAREVPIMAMETTTKGTWVQKTPGVCGGDACIRNTRITVHGLVHYRQLGLSDQRLMEVIQGLTSDDLAVAWDYYAGNPAEIEEAIRLNEEA